MRLKDPDERRDADDQRDGDEEAGDEPAPEPEDGVHHRTLPCEGPGAQGRTDGPGQRANNQTTTAAASASRYQAKAASE